MRCFSFDALYLYDEYFSILTKSSISQMERTFYFYDNTYKGSAFVPAFGGTHAPGRAGQHFDLFDSLFDR